jgi:predicted ATP-binding protein involved in virulence
MAEVPEHLLPLLHYQNDGSIIGDTPEAQAYVEKMGWGKENNSINKTVIKLANNINKWIIDIFDFSKTEYCHLNTFISIFFNDTIDALLNMLDTDEILKTSQHKRELINIIIESARKGSNYSDLLDALKQYNKDGKIDTKPILKRLPKEKIIKDVKPNQIKTLEIANYFAIESLNFPNLASNEVYILGRNGDGKTLILQAIIFALKYGIIKHISDKKEVGTLLDFLAKNPMFSVTAKTIDEAVLGNKVLADINNVYAYGAYRNQHTADKKDDDFDTEGFLTLFDNNKKLLSPDKWLLDTRLKELDALSKGEKITMTTNIAKGLLENLLNDEDDEKTLTIEVDASKAEVRYKERDAKAISFEQLSAGYQSVMVWVADLLARMSERQPTVAKLQDFEAIVLVDEVGLHLHPKWEYVIMQKLRAWFPKIQFIVTTHSPILLMGASTDAIIYKIDRQEGKTKLVGNIPQSEIRQMMSNQIITSPLFGLDTMAARDFKAENSSNDDFINAKIHEAIRQRLAEQPTLDDDTILQWINDELNNLPPID